MNQIEIHMFILLFWNILLTIYLFSNERRLKAAEKFIIESTDIYVRNLKKIDQRFSILETEIENLKIMS